MDVDAPDRTRREDANLVREVATNFDEAVAADSSLTTLRTPMRLIAENAQKLYFLATDEIDYIESCGDYVLIHVGDHKYIRRDTLTRLAVALHSRGFERIKRSVLINISRVSYAEKLAHGALAFVLASGARLVSKNRVKLACAHIGHVEGH
jgi:two-component system, LytTR family, response regulator